MGRNKKTYTDEFKKKCIQELMEGKSASEVCADNSISPSTLSDWKKAILENGFGSKELKIAQKLQQETEARLEAAKLLIWKKELEIELLKTKMSSAVKK
ncbi:MAG: transposase [Spirochaetales bacterium]|nr:transposase [Spirochaetales bacterium]